MSAAATRYTAVPDVSPDGVIVTNDVVVDPVNVPEPATASTDTAAAVLFVNANAVAAFDAAVASNLPLEMTTSPLVSVNAAVPNAEPAITVAPFAAILNTDAAPLLSQICK